MSWESQGLALLGASAVRPFGLAAAAWLVLRALRVRHPASRHAVWTAVLIGMLLLPIVSVIAPHWRLPVLPRKQNAAAQVPAASTPTEHRESATPQIADALESPASQAAARFEAPTLETVVLWIYLAGFCALAAYRAVGWVLLWRLVSRSKPLRRRLRESADVLTPVAIGVLHPAVLLPAGWRTWNAETRRAVLAHELAHLRRHDALVSALSRLVQCVFWFHPLAWWISRRISDLAELACDAAALEKVGDPAGYSRILLEFAEAVNRAGYRASLPGLAMAASSDMGRRIDQVFELSGGTLRKLSQPGLVLAALGVPAMCLAATVALGEPDAPQEPASQSHPAAFEVASVKTAVEPLNVPMICIVPCSPGERLSVSGSRVAIRFMSLYRLTLTAYRIQPYQLSGPDWMRSQRFDIDARIPSGDSSAAASGVAAGPVPEMLQALLAERFKLSIHRETKELPVYALVVGKNGAKLQDPVAETGGDPAGAPGSRELYTPQGEARVLENGTFVVTAGPFGPLRGGMQTNGHSKLEFLKLTMPGLVEVVTPHLDRPLVDRTNLKGSYYLLSESHQPEGGGRKTSGPPEGGRAGGDPDSGPPPDVFGEGLLAAIERAGLKLEKSTAPVEVIVVDRLEKAPTGN